MRPTETTVLNFETDSGAYLSSNREHRVMENKGNFDTQSIRKHSTPLINKSVSNYEKRSSTDMK